MSAPPRAPASVRPSAPRGPHAGRTTVLLRLGWAGLAAIAIAGLGVGLLGPAGPVLGRVDPAAYFAADLLARAEAYRAPLRLASLASLTLGVAVPALLAWSPPGRRLVERVVCAAGRDHPIRASVAVALAVVVGTDLVVLPLRFWAGYVHEGVWGFRTQGLVGWIRDQAVALGPGWLVTAAVVALGAVAVRRLPRAWPLALGAGGAVASAVLVLVAPLLLEPLEHRLAPLGDGPAREAVERVLAAAGRPDAEVLVADASRRTTKENAYVSGLGGTRRVVLYDNLLATRPPEEVAAVLAHELAHDAHRDVERGAALSVSGAIGSAAVAGAWGRGRRDLRDPRRVAGLLALLVLLSVAVLPITGAASRRAEAAADLGALELTGDADAQIALQRGFVEANLGDPSPPAWAVWLWSTHPTTAQRLELAARWERER